MERNPSPSVLPTVPWLHIPCLRGYWTQNTAHPPHVACTLKLEGKELAELVQETLLPYSVS